MQIRLAVKGFRECVEEGLLACVCRCGGYGVFDLWEGAEHLVDVDYVNLNQENTAPFLYPKPHQEPSSARTPEGSAGGAAAYEYRVGG